MEETEPMCCTAKILGYFKRLGPLRAIPAIMIRCLTHKIEPRFLAIHTEMSPTYIIETVNVCLLV
jgi:hypothetical protein